MAIYLFETTMFTRCQSEAPLTRDTMRQYIPGPFVFSESAPTGLPT